MEKSKVFLLISEHRLMEMA
ncbi:hypothetical protein CC1_12520 [Coprococcus catus GD/7]|uniref:Uncharacterized protein n=1 Tax=Coprococcus catus GD/7 TaxID=717962 RepID=D4J6T8_9FIRM|nr:hypothetical protein CC1_12520 [Coprococcus catus GD/7]